MWKTVKEMVGQKKFLAGLLSIATWVGARYGANLPSEEILPVVAPMWLYVFGQALADWGTGWKTPTSLWEAVKAMAGQKKFLAAVMSVAVWVFGRWGVQLDQAEILPLAGPIWGYIFGQGMADFGKTAKLAEADARGEVTTRADTADTAPARSGP